METFQRGRLEQLRKHVLSFASMQFSHRSSLRVNFATIKLLDLETTSEQHLFCCADAREQLDNHQAFLLHCRHRNDVNQARIKRPQVSVRVCAWARNFSELTARLRCF
jgi:hypothetical protein